MNGWLDGWVGGWMDGRTDGRTDGQINGCKGMDVWMTDLLDELASKLIRNFHPLPRALT